MSMHYRLSALLLVAALAGCSNFDISKRIPWEMRDPAKPEQPMKIAAMWTDTILNQPGRPSTRGFGGRLMFHATEGGKPIKVQGTLVVYAFDETDRDPSNSTPDKKYVFTPDQFSKHYSKSSIGHSYSVWLPWDEAGGEQKEISLIVRFMPLQGSPVVTEQSKHLLPGRPPSAATDGPPAVAPTIAAAPIGGAQPVAGAVQQAAYNVPAGMSQPMPTGPTPYAARQSAAMQPQQSPPQGVAQRQALSPEMLVILQQAGYDTRTLAAPAANAVEPGAATTDDARRRMTTMTIQMPQGPTYGQQPIAAPQVPQPSAYGQLPLGASNEYRPAAENASPAGAMASLPEAANLSRPRRLEAPWAGQSSTRYAPSRSRALGAPIAPLSRDRVPSQLRLVTQQSVPPSPPKGESRSEYVPSAY
jgi:hypothetical protein